MRFLILKDTKIDNEELDQLQTAFTDFVYEYTGLTPVFYVQSTDFSSVPTETDSDGDLKPTDIYLKSLMAGVYSQYGTYGVDSIVLLVDRDNWSFKGIWGTNWSNKYHQYHVHLCRFDKNNLANSLGTLYHEWMHSLDVLIKVHTGFDVHDIFRLPYDKFCVHGGRPDLEKTTKWKYIRHKENTDALKVMAPHLKRAYALRKDLHFAPYKKVQLRLISYLRSLLNVKNGVPRG